MLTKLERLLEIKLIQYQTQNLSYCHDEEISIKTDLEKKVKFFEGVLQQDYGKWFDQVRINEEKLKKLKEIEYRIVGKLDLLEMIQVLDHHDPEKLVENTRLVRDELKEILKDVSK